MYQSVYFSVPIIRSCICATMKFNMTKKVGTEMESMNIPSKNILFVLHGTSISTEKDK